MTMLRLLQTVGLLQILLFLVGCCQLLSLVDGYTSNHHNHHPFVSRQDMTGIWKLTHESLVVPLNPANDDSQKSTSGDGATAKGKKVTREIVLRLNEDGTFDPYTSGTYDACRDLHSVLGRGGSWEYRDENLVLAPDRPKNTDLSTVQDTVLQGKLAIHVSACLPSTDHPMGGEEEGTQQEASLTSGDDDQTGTVSNIRQDEGEDQAVDVHLSVPDGQVSIGKFMYPKKHKAFFDEPMLFHQLSIGNFTMSQLLGNLNARLKKEKEEEKVVAKYHKKDFYGRKFYLTSTPHKVNPTYAAKDKHYDEEKAKYDFRIMPITFHANNTFSAIGTEKILRGRFGLAGTERERLWFQVSLFGAGRSAPGSVYSEGRLLSHDDRRGYVGTVQEYQKNNQTLYFVEGEIYYGTDLKAPKKPNSMGTFTLQEIVAEEEDDDDEFDDEDDDNDDEDDGKYTGNSQNFDEEAFQ